MKKFICAILLVCASFSVSSASELPPIVVQVRVGQGFNVHYDGNVLVYEGKIDGKYGEDIFLLYQSDINDRYEIAPWNNYQERGNVSATLDCIVGSHVSVRFEYFDYDDYYSDNRTYYWNIPFSYIDDETGEVGFVYLAIRTEQNENFGSGCSAGVFTPLALLLLLPLILRRGFEMKKVFGVALLALAVFASSACAEYVVFPTLDCEIDIPQGWTHNYNGAGYVAIIAPDGKSALTLEVLDITGKDIKDIALFASKQNNGTEPQPQGNGYVFTFSANGITNTSYVSQASETQGSMIGKAGDAPEFDAILASIRDIQSTQTVKFPSVKITLDIEPGWTHEDNGEGTATIYILEKSSMTISRFDPEGMSLEQCAAELSKAHNGTAPLTISGIYYYHMNDNKTTVYVAPSDGGKEVVVTGMTPGSQEDLEAMQRMLKSSKDI